LAVPRNVGGDSRHHAAGNRFGATPVLQPRRSPRPLAQTGSDPRSACTIPDIHAQADRTPLGKQHARPGKASSAANTRIAPAARFQRIDVKPSIISFGHPDDKAKGFKYSDRQSSQYHFCGHVFSNPMGYAMSVNATTLENWTSTVNGLDFDPTASGKIVQSAGSVTISSSTYRGGGVAVMPVSIKDAESNDLFVKWSPNGGGQYARYFFSLTPANTNLPANEILGEGHAAMALTTHHTYAGSTYVKDGEWYYTRIYFDQQNKSVQYITSTGAYDTAGGSVIQNRTSDYSTNSTFDTELWRAVADDSLTVAFGVYDAYAGSSAKITLEEVLTSSETTEALLPTWQQQIDAYGGRAGSYFVQISADFAKAAYALAPWEKSGFQDKANDNEKINDIADSGGELRSAEYLYQQIFDKGGWTPLVLEFKSNPIPAMSYLKESDFIPLTSVWTDAGPFTGGFGLNLASIQNGYASGIYTYRNSAALLAKNADTVFIAFRGTNDARTGDADSGSPNTADPSNSLSPDKSDWLAMERHYENFRPLLNELTSYILNHNEIKNVQVTGHSLGGAMALAYMNEYASTLSGKNLQAVTFAAPGYNFVKGATGQYLDNVTEIQVQDDPVPNLEYLGGDFAGTYFHPGRKLYFIGDGTTKLGSNNHSMDYYREIAYRVDNSLWNDLLSLPVEKGSAVVNTSELNHHAVLLGGNRSILNKTESFKVASADDTLNTSIQYDATHMKDIKYVYGGGGKDILTGDDTGEVFVGGAMNDEIRGKSGIDLALYAKSKSFYKISKNADGSINVIDSTSEEGSDVLSEVERLSFSDINVAYDLDGNAGTAAKIIAAVFGKAAVANENFVGIGLRLLDSGVSYETLSALALNAAGATTREAVVNLLWTNVVGRPPMAGEAKHLVDALAPDLSNAGQLGKIAADYAATVGVVNLSELSQTGLDYAS
jgi:pimeloyl-ACP methyl ester carboxylesterase